VAALTQRGGLMKRPWEALAGLAPLGRWGARVQGALTRVVRPLARDLLEFALPQRCPGCGAPVAPEALLCERCLARLPRLAGAVCARCLLDERPPDTCRRHPGDAVHAAFVYDERVALLVQALKFGARPRLARACAPALAAALPQAARAPALVTAVPLHPVRRRERGYDQAACLAEALADAIAAPYVPDILARTRATAAQSGLRARERRRNVAGAFRVTRPAWVRGREVLVVDDVLTTGATLHEALATLRAAGARTRGTALAWAQ
jgi:ComF family protein